MVQINVLAQKRRGVSWLPAYQANLTWQNFQQLWSTCTWFIDVLFVSQPHYTVYPSHLFHKQLKINHSYLFQNRFYFSLLHLNTIMIVHFFIVTKGSLLWVFYSRLFLLFHFCIKIRTLMCVEQLHYTHIIQQLLKQFYRSSHFFPWNLTELIVSHFNFTDRVCLYVYIMGS